MFSGNDPQSLRQHAYATDDKLRLRYSIHEQYSVPKVDFPSWALKRIHWRGDEQVLDVGSGPGLYAAALRSIYPELHYFGIDFSAGMLESHPAKRRLSRADAQHLPFPAAYFDVVMANHMLYHVPDIAKAVQEFRRVLKPGGVLMASTNSIETMPQFRELFKRAILVLTTPGKPVQMPLPVDHLFTLESGVRQLARHFYAVVRYDLPSAFVFNTIEPVMAYLESTRSLREPQLPPGVTWESVMLIVREQIKNQLNYVGELVVNKLSGVLIATDRGDFIRDFVNHQKYNGRSR